MGFPGGSVVKNQPTSAEGPWSRKISLATKQLSPYAITIEPVLWSPGAVITEPMNPGACALQQEKKPQ